MFFKIDVLKKFVKFTGRHLCQSLFEFCEIFKNIFLYRTPPVTASDFRDVFVTKRLQGGAMQDGLQKIHRIKSAKRIVGLLQMIKR